MGSNSFITVKKAFFDVQKVLNESDGVLKRGLSKLGAYIRRTAQFSMKSKKGASAPGTPPHAHGKKFLRKFIFFSYVASTKTMVVGPVRLQRAKNYDVPRVEEHGEVRSIRTKYKTIIHRYPPRPSIAPAAAENIKKLPEIFSMNKARRK